MDAQHTEPDFCATPSPEARAARIEHQLAAFAAREATVRAFVCHDLSATQHQPAGVHGPRHDAPRNNAPRYGAPRYNAPRYNAWCVAPARRLGGMLLGKTVCTAFADALVQTAQWFHEWQAAGR